MAVQRSVAVATSSFGEPAAAEQPGPDLDELYEAILGRLRRELLVERERLGNLTGERFF
jgi:hypothetical protein